MNQFCWNLTQVGGICTFLDGEMLSAEESCQLGSEIMYMCVRVCALWTRLGLTPAALSKEGSWGGASVT